MSAAKNVINNNFRNMELNEFLAEALKDAGYGGIEVQKTPVGARLTLYVTRPGLVIGRKGVGIKDLMTKIEQKFGLQNPQISVLEITNPELNPQIMSNRIAQLIERGTAFRRAAMWSLNTIMSAGALGVEVIISGKLRTERAHFEKHTIGIVPKSGDVAGAIVKTGVTHVLTKMGLMGIRLRIASREALPQEFEIKDGQSNVGETEIVASAQQSETPPKNQDQAAEAEKGGKQDGKA
ncbi:MAG: 30S ribosomal protein S3 [Thermoproteota archaeon]|nr:30S ribosomal protein S3 [Thermoproteota archaeon]